MRTVQVLAFVVFSALLFAGGAWALAWWGTPRPPDPIEAGLEARPELKSPGALETAPERRSTGEIQAARAPRSVFGSYGSASRLLPPLARAELITDIPANVDVTPAVSVVATTPTTPMQRERKSPEDGPSPPGVRQEDLSVFSRSRRPTPTDHANCVACSGVQRLAKEECIRC